MDNKNINQFYLLILLCIILLFCFPIAVSAKIVIINLHKNIYEKKQQDKRQKIIDSFYETLKGLVHKDNDLLKKIPWKKGVLCEKLSNEQFNRKNHTYGMALEIVDNKNKVRFNLTMCDFTLGKNFLVTFNVEKFFIDKYCNDNMPINFEVLLKRYLFCDDSEKSSDLLDFAPFDKCNFSTFTMINSINKIGIIKKGNYYHKHDSYLLPSVIDSNNAKISLPFEPKVIKEYLFKKIVSSGLSLEKNLINQLKNNSSKFSIAFTNINSNNDFYIGYKIRYFPLTKEAQIITDFFYSVNLEGQSTISKLNFFKYERDATSILFDSNMKNSIDKQFFLINSEYNKTKKASDANIMRIDTGEVIKKAEMLTNNKKDLIRKFLKINEFKYKNYTKQHLSKEMEVYGYKSGRWDLTQIHKYILDKIVEFISNNYVNSPFKISISGFADRDPVKSGIRNPLYENYKIYYSPCNKNVTARLYDEDEIENTMILPEFIENNCQLSVLRAYAFAYKLNAMIPKQKIYYTGRGTLKDGKKFYNRKVVVEINMIGKNNE